MGVGQIKVVVVDRDGTLIDIVRDEETGAVTTAFHPSHLRFLPGAIDGLRRLRDAGFSIAIATNQPGPAKGHFSVDAVTRTNDALRSELARHGIEVASFQTCMHHPSGGPGALASLVGPCSCRKPLPGMINAIVDELGADRSRSWMIGDTQSDITAGNAAGLKTGLLLLENRCELCPLRHDATASAASLPTITAADLSKLASAILALEGCSDA